MPGFILCIEGKLLEEEDDVGREEGNEEENDGEEEEEDDDESGCREGIGGGTDRGVAEPV